MVLAAGQGKRMQSGVAKQYLLLKERPVIWYSLEAFEKSPVDEVILVTGKEGNRLGTGTYCGPVWV